MEPTLSPQEQDQRWDQIMATGLMLAVHGFLGAEVLGYLWIYVPRFKRIFHDFGMKLPWLTDLVITISDFMEAFPFLVPMVVIPLLAADGFVIYCLRRQRSTRMLSWAWCVLIFLLLQGAYFAASAAIHLPLVELMDGLAK